LIDRFTPRLASRWRWIRTASRSDPPPSLETRTKFSVPTILPVPFLSSHPFAPLTVTLQKALAEKVRNSMNDMPI
jgi:hypothetical protein